MEVAVVKIGNSKGIRLSKTLIEKYNIKDTVEVVLEEGPKTADLGGRASTQEVGKAIAEALP